MTGYTVHTGSTEKFSEGWDRIFERGSKSSKKKAASGSAAKSKKKAARKKSKAKS